MTRPTPSDLFSDRADVSVTMPDYAIEKELLATGALHVAGVDEAGRGCLAGPVVAAAVILDPAQLIDGLNDSKKLSAAAREALAPVIREQAICWAVASCSPEEIDRWNILHASMEAMRRAVLALGSSPDAVLVDGNRAWPRPEQPVRTVVRGDARSMTIAAASILAKTDRDARMRLLDREFPGYGWIRNKGYPTRDHYEALALIGPTPHHRRSFRLRLEPPVQDNLFAP